MTARALCPIDSGGSSLRKCTPSMIVSQDSTISCPSIGLSTAASSRKPRDEVSVASGAKYLAMMSNSPRLFPPPRSISPAIARAVFCELCRPRLMSSPVENTVHHFRLIIGKEGMGDIHIFGNRDACRHVIALQDLVGAGAQDCPEDRIDACEPPAFCQLLIDQRIDLELFAHHALDEIAEEGCLGVAILAVLAFPSVA